MKMIFPLCGNPRIKKYKVIPLAHAHLWPMDGTSSNDGSFRIRRVASGGTSSGHWARAVLMMGQGVTESVGRAAGRALGGGVGGGVGGVLGTGAGGGGSSGAGGSSVGSGRQRGGSAGGASSVVAGGDAGSSSGGGVPGGGGGNGGGGGVPGGGGSLEAGSSLSSWAGMRSGATWAFGGGMMVFNLSVVLCSSPLMISIDDVRHKRVDASRVCSICEPVLIVVDVKGSELCYTKDEKLIE